MRIAHLNNWNNLPWVIAEEQRRRGQEVDVFNLTKDDMRWSGNCLNIFSRMTTKWKEYDVIFAHNCTLLSHGLEDKLGLDNVIYWHHGEIEGGCELKNKPHLVSSPNLLSKCSGAQYIPYPVNLEYWKSKNKEARGVCDLDKISGVKWQDLCAYLDRYERFYSWGGRAFSYLACQAMALNKSIELQGIDWELYDHKTNGETPREYVRLYHNVKNIVVDLTNFVDRWRLIKE